jgi:hypothetical protein
MTLVDLANPFRLFGFIAPKDFKLPVFGFDFIIQSYGFERTS